MSLRVVFMGTPDFSVPALEAILSAGHEVVAAYSQPPRQAGRGMKERKSPVQQKAERLGIPVLTPTDLKSAESHSTFLSHRADIAVVVAYGLILPKPILDGPVHGCLNIHASLLPRWRGAAPINRAIMSGDPETGVMIMKMDVGLDTGPIMCAEKTPIGENETAGALHDRLSALGGSLIVEALTLLEKDENTFQVQSEAGTTYAQKISKSETRVDWTRGAVEVHRHIRGLAPFPGAWCSMPFGKTNDRVKILGAERVEGPMPNGTKPGTVLDDLLTIACETGAVRPTLLQRAGKQALDRETFLRGYPMPAGTHIE